MSGYEELLRKAQELRKSQEALEKENKKRLLELSLRFSNSYKIGSNG